MENPTWDDVHKEWEPCRTCTSYAYQEETKEPFEPPLTWNPSRGPKPECLDWSDQEILDSLYHNLGLGYDKPKVEKEEGNIVEYRKHLGEI